MGMASGKTQDRAHDRPQHGGNGKGTGGVCKPEVLSAPLFSPSCKQQPRAAMAATVSDHTAVGPSSWAAARVNPGLCLWH